MTRDVSRERTRNYITQLKGSFVFKILAVGCSFLAIPIMIKYLGQEQFGIWSTLLSIVTWVVFFDLGIGNGLRNKLAESLAKNEIDEAVSYISSGYSLIGLVSVILFVLLLIASFVIPWQSVFNTDAVLEEELRNVVLFTGFAVIANFWISLINQVLNAAQKASVVVFGQFLFNLMALIGVYILSLITDTSLLYLSMAFGFSLIVANVLLSCWFYQKRSELIPKLSLNHQHIKPLLSLGGQFFVIQVAVLVIFTTDKILIAQLLGPLYVTHYDVVFKLFGVFTMIYAMVSAPLWPAYTDAYHRGDIAWIKAALQRQLWVFAIISLAVIMMLLLAKPVIALWVGEEVEVSMLLVFSMAAFVLVSIWNSVFAYVVNGLGELKLQMVTAMIGMFANIPLSLLLVKFFLLGVEGVVWATVISLLPFTCMAPVQVYYLLRRGANEVA